MSKVAILIPVYNHIEFTVKCIEQLVHLLSNSTFRNCQFKIVVIDDGSTDGTSEWLRKEYPDVHLVVGDGSLWWSGGINRGAEYAQQSLLADFLLLWNNDIIPAQDYFTQIDDLMVYLDDKTIVGSKIYYENRDIKDLVWSFGGFFNPKNGKKSMLAYNVQDSADYNEPVDVDWLPGMGTLVPVPIIAKIGLWDENDFPQYHGDSDFTFRAKTAGYKVRAYPQLRLWNDKSSSGLEHGDSFKGLIKSLTNRRSNTNMRDNFRFYKRHSSSVLAYKELIIFYSILIGGFMKWKVLSLFGIRRKVN